VVLDFSTSPAGGIGVEVPGYTFITGAQSKPGRVSPKTERYQMGGSYPQFTAYFDAVNPGQSVYAKFRLQFDNCGTVTIQSSISETNSDVTSVVPYAVTATLTGTAQGEPIEVYSDGVENYSVSSGSLTEAYAEVTETLACPPGEGATYNALQCLNC